jgi:spore coat protein A
MTDTSRRNFLQYSVAAGAALGISAARPGTAAAAAARPGLTRTPLTRTPLPPTSLTRYVEPVPLPGAGIVVATPTSPNHYAFSAKLISRQLHPALPPTPVFAYDDGSGLSGQAGSFGMAIAAQVGTPIHVKYTNNLPPAYPSWIPVDLRLTPLGDQVRMLTHLHGGFVAGADDGNPAVTPDGFGPGKTQSVVYPNEAPQNSARLMWFHDHATGATRLNVFAGLAGAYILRDEFDTGAEPNPIGVPGGAYEVPLVFQDRQFNTDGTFLYPVSTIPGVTWIGEYFGDHFLVNGKVWPYLDVEPRLYRFRILNGCNARIMSVTFGGAPMWQIGAEGGLWDIPVKMSSLTLTGAERADVIVDFRGLKGHTLYVRNNTPAAPVSTPAPPLAQIMQIRVGTTVTTPGPTLIPAQLPGVRPNLPSPNARRFITLNEIGASTASWYLNLDGAHFGKGALRPRLGNVEDWAFINMTPDTHPMHTHLFTHQVIGRVPFDVAGYQTAHGGPNGVPGGINPSSFATGPMLPPTPDERGWKETTKANPGYYTIVRARIELPTGVTAPQSYVHHCHIVEHEDNDMMQAFVVQP